ncbi:GNAT family N-acetyltransferase [Streptomyces indicus]|uniref:Predicted N-acetyltransferase YhbS n=1 Tax=Streptomyces indicus TaxID=417292 RepID=A0A1G8XX94_9ACTN|nr:GNAT family N-acetyltransferase [Streptomyces indicus]SDJ94515.1 Predicted N-acetyltransferase YhbS [Streptomyces indicus]
MTHDMRPPRHDIRLATAADVPAVQAVTDAAYAHYIERIGLRPVPMDADHAANVAAGRVHVTGDPVIGLLVLVPEPGHLFLDSLAVHPSAHGQGVGRALLEYTERHARELGLGEIRLYTNAKMWENQKLYPYFGYELVERRVEDGVYDRFHYRKRLA